MSIAQTINGYHTPKRRKLSHDTTGHDAKQIEGVSPTKDIESQDDEASSEEDSVKNPNNAVPSQQASSKGTSRIQHSPASLASRISSSTTFHIQTTELLRDIKPNHVSRLKKAKPQIERIYDAINSIPEQKPLSLAEVEAFARKRLKVAIPWGNQPSSDINYKFSFAKPTKILTTGNLVHRICLREHTNVILLPEMPGELLQEKDYLNFRAIHKRGFYLACIASALQRDIGDDFDLSYFNFDDNNLVPVLALIPKIDTSSGSRVNFMISPSFAPTLGPIEKMLPGQTCLRKEDAAHSNAHYQIDRGWIYNSTIRAISAISAIHTLVENAADMAENFRDACLLGAIWLRQRGFDSPLNAGGFGVAEWAVVSSLLLKSGGPQGRPLFSSRYSAVQLFKAMLQTLSTRYMMDPYVVRGSYQVNKSDRPVMLDAATGINIFYKMTPSSYARLRLAATTSLAAVNSQKVAGFESAFISTVSDPILLYDEVYEIKLEKAAFSRVQLQLYGILQRGLGARVSLIDIKGPLSKLWPLSASEPVTDSTIITIGLLVNPGLATRLVDNGPLVEEKDASKEFRTFWGEKAELRKFKDGRINESLTWSADSPVTQQIIDFLCLKYFNVQLSAVKFSTPVETFWLPSAVLASHQEVFTTVNAKFQSLSSDLHHLDSLPLPIRSVTPASSYLRSSSVDLLLEAGPSRPIDVIVQFDTSSRWPDHLAAIQYTKIAFLTKVLDLLTATDKSLTTRIGLENTSTSVLGTHNTSFLDISHQSSIPTITPMTFRLRIYHDRELHLIQQELNSKTNSLQGPLRDTYQSALITQKRICLASPQHTAAIRNLITLFAPLSTTIRLLKCWVSAHHLTNHIPEPVLEIICANVFLSPLPWMTPGTPTSAFARCLHFLAKWNWTSEPLIVDLSPSQDMTLEQRAELATRFAAWRKLDPNLNTVAWFLGTNIDPTGVVWTQSDMSHKGPQPPRVIAGRVSALAAAAIQVVKFTDDSETVPRTIMAKADWDAVFTSSLADFDFVIHLKSDVVGGGALKGKKKKQYKNLELASSMEIDRTGIDDVEAYVEDLEESFGGAALFLYGGRHSGNSVVGGLWRPHLLGEKVWKIRLGCSTVPVPAMGEVQGEDAMCTANLEGMLAEMVMMGEGIVDRISRKQQS